MPTGSQNQRLPAASAGAMEGDVLASRMHAVHMYYLVAQPRELHNPVRASQPTGRPII
jgi:hypothetical protein